MPGIVFISILEKRLLYPFFAPPQKSFRDYLHSRDFHPSRHILFLSQRNKLESVPQALVKVFKTTDLNVALSAFDNVDEDLDKLTLWIDENLPDEYAKPGDLVRAYDYLSRASLFLGRVQRRRNYNMWRYATSLMTSGIVIAKE